MSVSKHILDTVLTVPPQDIFHLKHGLTLFPELPVVVLSSHGLYAKLTVALGYTVGWEDWLDARNHWVKARDCVLVQVPRDAVAQEFESRLNARAATAPYLMLEEI